MFRCLDCGEIFEEADEIRTTWEAYYGVASDFHNHTPMILEVCPNCHSDNIEDFIEEDEDEDFELE